MAGLDDFFKFKVGDWVATILPQLEQVGGNTWARHPLLITARRLEECTGGPQVHYCVRATALHRDWLKGGEALLGLSEFFVNEIHLVAWEECMAKLSEVGGQAVD